MLERKWYPTHEPFDYPQKFVDWINSLNNDFRNRIRYEPFELYKQQALSWLNDEVDTTAEDLVASTPEEPKKDFFTSSEKVVIRKHILIERDRCGTNTMYNMDKYHLITSSDRTSGYGYMQYTSEEAQRIMLFLFDCGYCFLFGKCRQIWFSTTMGGAVLARARMNPGYRALYIAEQEDKGETVFDAKFREPFERYQWWWRGGKMQRNARGKMKFDTFSNSTIDVLPPKEYGATGDVPDLVAIDEIGLVKNAKKIISEVGPAMYSYRPGEELKFTRQVCCWGTGAKDPDGIFEGFWKETKEHWEKGKYRTGMFIPVMFNVWARSGMNQQLLDDEYERAYSDKTTQREELIAKYHHHYPLDDEDMFYQSSRTLLSMEKIKANKGRILNAPPLYRPRYGYFEPVYDYSRPIRCGGKNTYVITGAIWKALKSRMDDKCTCIVYSRPPDAEKPWKDRYFMGVDPLTSETGHSKVSGSVWDNEEETIACVVNYREDFNLHYSFEQLLCMKLWYTGTGAVIPELVERNQGSLYYEYLDVNNALHNTVWGGELPTRKMKAKSGAGALSWGIDKFKGETTDEIINYTFELYDTYGQNFWIPELWKQQETFIKKETKQQNGFKVKYQARNVKMDYDDVIFSATFAYICCRCFPRRMPVLLAHKEAVSEVRRYREPNGTLRLGNFINDRLVSDVTRSNYGNQRRVRGRRDSERW